MGQFKEGAAESDILFESSLFIQEIITEETEPAIDSPGDRLTISTTIKFGILYASGGDILELATETIHAHYRGSDLKAVPGSIRISAQETPQDMDDWAITIQWNETISYNSQEIIQLIVGKKPTEATDIIQEVLGLTQEPEISLRPNWWIRLPILPFRISILQTGE